MKNFIIGKCINYIEKTGNYSKGKLKEIEYGLISIYLTITKTIFILLISVLLGIIKETIILMLFFSVLRTTAFGIHASKSWVCWISSIVIFLLIPYTCNLIIINKYLVQIICLIGVLLIYKNSPADTKKRPIVSKKRRNLLKSISTIIAILYSVIAICLNNNFITNCICFSLILENILISPLVYKIFKLPYNNYITFLKNHPDFIEG